MITIIFGLPRSGKTALMTKFALDYMTGANARQDIKASIKEIKKFNQGGFNLSYPTNHLVFSDYDIWTKNKTLFSYFADGFSFGLPNEQRKNISFFPPCSRLFFDESQKYYNSRDSARFPDFASRGFELHGHLKINIFLAVHRVKLIDLNIRELSARVIEVKELKHKYDCGAIVSSTWICKEYLSASEALKSIDGLSSKYKTVKFTFQGNIFKHYDSEFFKYAFLKDRYLDDFDMQPNCGYKCNVSDIKRFNEEHDCSVPDDFYKVVKKNGK